MYSNFPTCRVSCRLNTADTGWLDIFQRDEYAVCAWGLRTSWISGNIYQLVTWLLCHSGMKEFANILLTSVGFCLTAISSKPLVSEEQKHERRVRDCRSFYLSVSSTLIDYWVNVTKVCCLEFWWLLMVSFFSSFEQEGSGRMASYFRLINHPPQKKHCR